jgi:hypothetical protein
MDNVINCRSQNTSVSIVMTMYRLNQGSISGRGRDLSIINSVQNVPRTIPASYPMGPWTHSS